MGDEEEEAKVDVSGRVKVIKTDMEETMRDALMLTVAEVFDKAREKTTANKDIIYKNQQGHYLQEPGSSIPNSQA